MTVITTVWTSPTREAVKKSVPVNAACFNAKQRGTVFQRSGSVMIKTIARIRQTKRTVQLLPSVNTTSLDVKLVWSGPVYQVAGSVMGKMIVRMDPMSLTAPLLSVNGTSSSAISRGMVYLHQHWKVLLNSFHFNGCTLEFHPQTQK